MTGARIGNWYLEEEIGRGALGVVYRARGYDEASRRAAVKVFTAPATRDPAFVQKFPAELLPLQRLDHANIAKFYDSGSHAGLAYIACELVEGQDFVRLLEAGRRPWREVLSVAVQAARALKHAHNRNVLHRDLKPAHLMLTADGTLKVLSFGWARVLPAVPASHTPALGSAAYQPPETSNGKPFTRRSDFYSLGGVLYTLVTGRPPFTAHSLVELLHKQCFTLPERPALLVPDLPPELDEFICGLLDKNPARRPASATHLLEELERIRAKLERKGERLDWPAKLTPDTAETAALPASLAAGGVEADRTEPRPLLQRPIVVVPLFLAVVAVLIAAFTWPTESAEELFAAAEPLLASDNPDDWERAFTLYLDRLTTKYPDRFTAEIAAARTRLKDLKELRRALAEGARVEPRSDAERAYWRGLRLAQAGEVDSARRVWTALLRGFAPVSSEARWVELAKAGLDLLDRAESQTRRPPPDRTALEAAIAAARALAQAGKSEDADTVLKALEELVADDPAARELVRSARDGKK
jgi:hypothetical protein